MMIENFSQKKEPTRLSSPIYPHNNPAGTVSLAKKDLNKNEE